MDWVDTVLVEGRVYLSVEDLVGSLRGRAAMFAEIALMPVEAGDELYRVAGRAKATELTSRADALVVAGFDHLYESRPVATSPPSGNPTV